MDCRVLHTYVSTHKGEVDGDDKGRLRVFFEGRAKEGDGQWHGLDEGEFRELEEAVKA